MKQITLLILIFCQLLLSACTQIATNSLTNDAYDYPVKPGTKEWNSFTAYSQKIKACQIPEDVLAEMPTSSLADTVLNYPLYGDMFLHNTPQQGLDSLKAQFNGLTELIKRDDVGIVLLNLYHDINITSVEDDEIGEFYFSLSYLEMLMSQYAVLNTLTEEEIIKLVKEANNKHNENQQKPKLMAEFTVLLLGRSLQHYEYEAFLKEIEHNSKLDSFLKSGFADQESINKIQIFTEEFLAENN